MGLFDDIGSFVSNATKSVQNFYGVDNSGKWTNQGGAFKWVDEGIGELTGRNQSRAALNLANNQFNYAQQQAQALVANQQWQRQQADIMGSNAAAAATASARATSGINFSNATPTSFGPGAQPQNKDFLGL